MQGEAAYDGVILDVDGTIWNTTGIVAVAWNRAIEKSGFAARKVNAGDLQREFGKTMDKIAADLWPSLGAAEREALMSYCCTEEMIALRENTLDITYPGVVSTVQALSQRVDFFVVSNCQQGYIELMLQKTGLAPFVRDSECFGRTGKGKAENLQLLAARNGLRHPLYVGDTQGDCDACAQARVAFAWAAYGFGQADTCVARLGSFADLAKVVG